jgi:hypothetical protein
MHGVVPTERRREMTQQKLEQVSAMVKCWLEGSLTNNRRPTEARRVLEDKACEYGSLADHLENGGLSATGRGRNDG